MARKPRVEYAGAVYHVMSRGNRQQTIFRTDDDCEMFLITLGEACKRTGWKIHAYVLMGNHYHLLLETPEPNLVTGMQWLQSTYSKRFNARHHEWGHLFQGRYKAIPVEWGGGYFSTVATYIHLNPVRMKGYDFEGEKLRDYRWSSYRVYIGKSLRMEWLCVSRVLDSLNMQDTPAGRQKYARYMGKRVEEIRQSDKPWRADESWQKIRRGWFFGSPGFREARLENVESVLKKGKRTSFAGEEIKAHDATCAEGWIAKGMLNLGLSEADLKAMKMNSPKKYALAWLARRNTCASPSWIKERLGMGTATCFAHYLKKMESLKYNGAGKYHMYKEAMSKIFQIFRMHCLLCKKN